MHEASLLEKTQLTCLLMPVTYTLLIPMPMATNLGPIRVKYRGKSAKTLFCLINKLFHKTGALFDVLLVIVAFYVFLKSVRAFKSKP